MTPEPGDRAGADEVLATLEEGIRRFKERDVMGAHACFERAHRRRTSDPRVMSWYGVTLVLVEKNSNLGILYVDQAVRAVGTEPELLLNQARAHLALGQRERAVKAIQRGLEALPDHPGLLAAQASMGWRRRPLLPFLGRSNPLNRLLGRLRHRVAKNASAPAELSPLTLGLDAEVPPRS